MEKEHMIGYLDDQEKEFARGILAAGWRPKELYQLTQPDVAVDREATLEESAIGCFCGEFATALLSTSRLFLAGKRAAEARAAGEDSFEAMPCDNR